MIWHPYVGPTMVMVVHTVTNGTNADNSTWNTKSISNQHMAWCQSQAAEVVESKYKHPPVRKPTDKCYDEKAWISDTVRQTKKVWEKGTLRTCRMESICGVNEYGEEDGNVASIFNPAEPLVQSKILDLMRTLKCCDYGRKRVIEGAQMGDGLVNGDPNNLVTLAWCKSNETAVSKTYKLPMKRELGFVQCNQDDKYLHLDVLQSNAGTERDTFKFDWCPIGSRCGLNSYGDEDGSDGASFNPKRNKFLFVKHHECCSYKNKTVVAGKKMPNLAWCEEDADAVKERYKHPWIITGGAQSRSLWSHFQDTVTIDPSTWTLKNAKNALVNGKDALVNGTKAAYNGTVEAVVSAYEQGKDSVNAAYEQGKDSTIAAYNGTKSAVASAYEQGKDTGQKLVDAVDDTRDNFVGRKLLWVEEGEASYSLRAAAMGDSFPALAPSTSPSPSPATMTAGAPEVPEYVNCESDNCPIGAMCSSVRKMKDDGVTPEKIWTGFQYVAALKEDASQHNPTDSSGNCCARAIHRVVKGAQMNGTAWCEVETWTTIASTTTTTTTTHSSDEEVPVTFSAVGFVEGSLSSSAKMDGVDIEAGTVVAYYFDSTKANLLPTIVFQIGEKGVTDFYLRGIVPKYVPQDGECEDGGMFFKVDVAYNGSEVQFDASAKGLWFCNHPDDQDALRYSFTFKMSELAAFDGDLLIEDVVIGAKGFGTLDMEANEILWKFDIGGKVNYTSGDKFSIAGDVRAMVSHDPTREIEVALDSLELDVKVGQLQPFFYKLFRSLQHIG